MRTIRMLAFAGVSVLAIASPAIAQDTAAKDSEESGFASNEIVVEARRRDESVQDVPLVVQAVTAQDLADLNIRQFKDIQTLVPGLALSESSNGVGAQAAIRGIAYDVNASGNNGTIEFYMNDAHLSSGMLFQSMFDVQQIEVLRGPQGTLRGRASPSGSITVTTTKPNLSEAGGYVSGQINDIGGWNINGAINVPVIEDRLGIRIAGIVDESNANRVRSYNSTVKPSSKMNGIRVSALFEPIDGLRLAGFYTGTVRDVISFDQVESNFGEGEATDDLPYIRAKDRRAVQAVPRSVRQDFDIYSWTAEYRAFGQKLNYVGTVNKQRIDSFNPGDVGIALPAAGPSQVPGFTGDLARAAGQVVHTRGKEQSHEIRLSSDERVAGIFDYVVGYLYDKLTSPTDLVQETPLFAGPLVAPAYLGNLATLVDRYGAVKEESVFANINAHIGDATEISGGIRHISYKSNGSVGLLKPGATEWEIAPEKAQNLKHTIYSASIKHNFNDSLMAYASFGTSWRPGSVTNPIIIANKGVNLNAADDRVNEYLFPNPEKSESYEIGIKSDWFDRRLRVNLTAFHQDFKNYAYSTRRPLMAGEVNGFPGVVTLDPSLAVGVPAKVDGVEAEVAFQATPHWNMNLVAAYAKSKIKNGTVPCNEGVDAGMTYDEFVDAAGGQLALCNVNYRAGTAAPFNMTFQTDYNHPVSDSLDGYVRGLVTYYGKSQNDPANPYDDVKSYGVVNLFAGLRDHDGAWEFGIYGKNVFDVLRVISRTADPLTSQYAGLAGSFLAESAYRGITINNPQEFGLTFRAAIGSR